MLFGGRDGGIESEGCPDPAVFAINSSVALSALKYPIP